MKLENNLLTVEISEQGAELQSIRSNASGREYLWQGDSAFWGRRSPVLFPIVGKAWEGQVRYGDKTVEIGQHGFARDRKFTLVDNTDENTITLRLDADEETMRLFPFNFSLEISYTLVDDRVTVGWKVINNEIEREMPFQIGAHPAFYYPSGKFTPDGINGYLAFDRHKEVTYELIEAKGCLGAKKYPIEFNSDGFLAITPDLFDRDALVIGDDQIHRISILSTDFMPYMTVLFRAPIVGIWSKPGAPFICIEPWYGRCDRVNYYGDFAEREYTQHVAPGEEWEASYCMIFEGI